MTTPMNGNTQQWPLLPRPESSSSEATSSLLAAHTVENLLRAKPQEMILELDRWNSAEGICYATSYDYDFDSDSDLGNTLSISLDPKITEFVAQEKAQYEKRKPISLKKLIGGTAIVASEPVGVYYGGVALEKYAVIATNMIGIVVMSAEIVLFASTAMGLLKLNDRVNKQKRMELKSRLNVADSTYALHDTGELTHDLASNIGRILRTDENPRLFWEGIIPNIMSIMNLERTLQVVNKRKKQLEKRLEVLGIHDASIVYDVAACDAQRSEIINNAQVYLHPITERLEQLDSQAKAELIEQRMNTKLKSESVQDVYIADEAARDFYQAIQAVLQCQKTTQSQELATSDAQIGIKQLLSTVDDPRQIELLYEPFRRKYKKLELPNYEDIQNIVAKNRRLR